MKFFLILMFFMFFCPEVTAAPEISAESSCLMIAETGEVVYEFNGSERCTMASTTKIMTALIAIERCNLSDMAEVSAYASGQEGSSAYLAPGNKIPVVELLYGLMLNSGNDAAVVIAEHISGSEKAFAELMTEEAHSIGAVNTSFRNPSGLDEEGHYTTAKDLALISCKAMENKTFREIVSSQVHKTDYSSGSLYFANHNKLLKMYEGCIGIKTGYTKKSGRCLVSAAERNGITLVCVTLNDPDDWNDHKKLLDYGFDKVNMKTIVKKGYKVKELRCDNGTNISVETGDEISLPATKKARGTKLVLHTVPEINESVEKGDKLGECEVFFNNRKVGEIDLVAGEVYERKKTFFELYFKKLHFNKEGV